MTRGSFRLTWMVLLLASPGAAQAPDTPFASDDTAAATPWTHLDFGNRPDNFQFAILTDRTGGHRAGVFRRGVERVNLLRPEFVMSVGDLIEGYSWEVDEIARQWRAFDRLIAPLTMPFFYVPGNHDVSNEVMTAAWEDRFGRPYYHFVYRDVLFLVLNSEDESSGQIGGEQRAYVEDVLGRYPDVRWTLVFVHKPLWEFEPNQNGWAEIERRLTGRPFTVFAGHRHRYLSDVRDGAHYVVLGTMGARSRRRGAPFGEFDHFMWVTLTDDGPIMANLALDGVYDSHVMTRQRRTLRRSVQAGAAVRSDGIVVDTKRFAGGTTTLRLTNDADVPMQVELDVDASGKVRPSITTLTTTVPPNSVELVDLTLAPTTPTAVPVSGLEPVVANWTIRYDLEGELDPLEMRGTHRIVIDTPRPLAVAGGIEIDGVLDDNAWQADLVSVVPGQVQAPSGGWFGPVDASFCYSVIRDARANLLYLAVDVIDDRVVVNSRRRFPRQDGVLVQVDGRPAADRRTGRGADSRSPLLFAVVPSEHGATLAGDATPARTRASAQRTERGYSVEIAIPIGEVAKRQAAPLESIRLNIGVNDMDGRGQADRIWLWPEWGTPEEVVESGVFKLR